jgi:membrane-associated phospholipid phosphatase
MKDIIKVFRFIGFNGPIILIFLCLYFIWDRPAYWFLYIVGILANLSINTFLKQWIQEPRPDGYLQHIENPEVYKNGQEYGMPSGHAQTTFYSVIFIYLVFKNINLTFFYFLLSLLTLYQRVKYKNHTFNQVIIGSLIGSIVGYLIYYLATKKITGKLHKKKDDNALQS